MIEDEFLDLVDEKDNIIGKEKRSVIYAKGLKNFRVVNILCKKRKGTTKIILPKPF